MNATIRSLIAEDSGDSDVWGWGMGHMFSLAAALYLRDEPTPADWHYRPSPLMTEEGEREDSMTTSELLDMLDAGTVGAEDIRQAGRVMNRYLDCVKRAGKDY